MNHRSQGNANGIVNYKISNEKAIETRRQRPISSETTSTLLYIHDMSPMVHRKSRVKWHEKMQSRKELQKLICDQVDQSKVG